MAFIRSVRERGRTCKFRPVDLPKAESPAQRLDLKGHPSDKKVRRVVVLPESGNIATACEDGHVRVFDAGGDANPLLDIPAHAKSVLGLAVLDEPILASGAVWDSKLHTWDARTGERICTIDVGGDRVSAIAAVGSDTFVTGVESGDSRALVFITHTCGRQLAEVARHENTHSYAIRDIAGHDDLIVTTSDDKTARVWSVSTRKPLAVLRGHRKWVYCAAVNSRYIATGSLDNTVRLHANRAEFPLISVLDGPLAHGILTVQFIHSDLLLSGSLDGLIFTALSQDAPTRLVGHMETNCYVMDTVITKDGRIAWAGTRGAARVWAPPRSVADAAKKHALTTFRSVSSAIVLHEPPPPLQGALVDAHAGRITAGEACRNLLNADRCSASISEWWCGHQLLMLAVQRREVAGGCELDIGGKVAHNYWFKNLYLPTKRIRLGTADRERVEACLHEAKNAGVIEGTETVLGAIDGWLDLQEEVSVLRDSGRQMLMALSIALLDQATSRAELKRLSGELTRMDRVQKISLLLNAVFSVAPLAGGAAAGAGVAVFGMAPDLIESILGSGVGLLGAATPPVVDRFVRQTAEVISSWASVPAEAQKSISAAVEGLQMTWEEFCEVMLKANDAVLGKDDKEFRGGLDGIVLEKVEGAAEGENDLACVSIAFEGMPRVPTRDKVRGEEKVDEGEEGGDRRSGREHSWPQKSRDEETANDSATSETPEANSARSSSEVVGTCLPTNRGLTLLELESLALNADKICQMNEKQTSSLLAAAMVKFKERHVEKFAVIERCISGAFESTLVDGEALLDALDVDEVLEIVGSGLNIDNEYLALEGKTRKVLEGRLRSYLVKLPRGAS